MFAVYTRCSLSVKSVDRWNYFDYIKRHGRNIPNIRKTLDRYIDNFEVFEPISCRHSYVSIQTKHTKQTITETKMPDASPLTPLFS